MHNLFDIYQSTMNRFHIYIFMLLLSACSSSKELSSFKEEAIRIEKDKVVAYFEKDRIQDDRLYEIVDTINLGIELFHQLINGPFDWQKYGNKQITYYFEPGKFIAHTTKLNEIEIPIVWYEKRGTSPWLHETIHILLRPKEGFWWPYRMSSYFHMPQWLTEGMAEYLSMRISHENNLPKWDGLFGNYLTLDSVCLSYLQGEHGKNVLRYIGKPGFMVKMKMRNGRDYVPVFYTSSASFTKYIAENYSLNVLVEAYSQYKNEHITIERLTDRSLDELKEEWLQEIGFY